MPASWPLPQICGERRQRRSELFPDQGQSLLGTSRVIGLGHQVALLQHVDSQLTLLQKASGKGLPQHLPGQERIDALIDQQILEGFPAQITVADGISLPSAPVFRVRASGSPYGVAQRSALPHRPQIHAPGQRQPLTQEMTARRR